MIQPHKVSNIFYGVKKQVKKKVIKMLLYLNLYSIPTTKIMKNIIQIEGETEFTLNMFFKKIHFFTP